jgi:hypothetical protein
LKQILGEATNDKWWMRLCYKVLKQESVLIAERSRNLLSPHIEFTASSRSRARHIPYPLTRDEVVDAIMSPVKDESRSPFLTTKHVARLALADSKVDGKRKASNEPEVVIMAKRAKNSHSPSIVAKAAQFPEKVRSNRTSKVLVYQLAIL